MSQCRICNAPNTPQAQRCESCGAWLDVAAETSRSASPQPQPPSATPAPSDPTEVQVLALMRLGRKIDAIKLYRQTTGVGLKEAKDAVEEIARRYGIDAGSASGCAASVVFLVAIVVCVGAAVAVYLLARP